MLNFNHAVSVHSDYKLRKIYIVLANHPPRRQENTNDKKLTIVNYVPWPKSLTTCYIFEVSNALTRAKTVPAYSWYYGQVEDKE